VHEDSGQEGVGRHGKTLVSLSSGHGKEARYSRCPNTRWQAPWVAS